MAGQNPSAGRSGESSIRCVRNSIRVAYRMLGSVADAEDVVQDAFLRWMATDRGAVREPEAFLRRIVTRLCLDQLKSARRRREVYPGEWLPEPMVESDERRGRRRHAAADDGARAPVAAGARRLHPARRVRCRLRRGRRRRSAAMPPPAASLPARALAMCARTGRASTVPKERGLEIAEAFFTASRSGDMTALSAMLAADVSMHSDGGGKKPAAMKPMLGFDEVDEVARRARQVLCREAMSRFLRYGFINGLPGFVTIEADDTLQTTALDISRRQDCRHLYHAQSGQAEAVERG